MVPLVGEEGPGSAPTHASAPRYRRPDRFPYWFVTLGLRFLVGTYLRIRLEGRERLPAGPAILCFNHQGWTDPFVLVAALPARPDLVFFGPSEADMSVGVRNRLISWSGRDLPFHPERTNLLDATRNVQAALNAGVHVAIAAEGRIHAGERGLLPLNEGVAYFALRAHVPIVPVAVAGVGWLRFGKTIRVRIGEPIPAAARPTRSAIGELTSAVRASLLALLVDGRDEPPPGRVGRWLTELFNDWPEGARPGLIGPDHRPDAGIAGGARPRGVS